MPRNVRSLVSDLLALALGFAVAGFSTTVLSAARATTRSTSALPTVWLLSPADSQAVTGTVTLAASASQDTEALQFQLNGGNLGPTITSALVTWNTNQPSSSSVDYGLTSYTNSSPFDLTMTTQHAVTVVGLQPGTTYHFRVASWNGVGLLGTSNDFTFTTAAGSAPGTPSNPSGPVGCTTPDPFTAMGGGTCVNGGWLPMGAAAFIAQVGTPVMTGGCNTPDPFTAIGGGTCVNGGWLPRNVAAPPPPPPATPSPVTAPPPPVNSTACNTPDPFLALGGGTCFNGGWFPPGMLPSVGNVTPVAPPPAPPQGSGGCVTPDPFVGIAGLRGVCVNGGWYPVRSGS